MAYLIKSADQATSRPVWQLVRRGRCSILLPIQETLLPRITTTRTLEEVVEDP